LGPHTAVALGVANNISITAAGHSSGCVESREESARRGICALLLFGPLKHTQQDAQTREAHQLQRSGVKRSPCTPRRLNLSIYSRSSR
jgi:hypothetical protein